MSERVTAVGVLLQLPLHQLQRFQLLQNRTAELV